MGHRAIGLVLRIPSPPAEPVRHGFRQAVRELGLADSEFRAALEEWSPAAADRCLAGLRHAGATAAVCFGDRQAVLLEAAARRPGLRVPDDLAPVAYDDEIPLTAVPPPKYLLGRRSCSGRRSLSATPAAPLSDVASDTTGALPGAVRPTPRLTTTQPPPTKKAAPTIRWKRPLTCEKQVGTTGFEPATP
ncbi:substrate-binding domain-containing protein [Streptomyces sp. NPDC002676]